MVRRKALMTAVQFLLLSLMAAGTVVSDNFTCGPSCENDREANKKFFFAMSISLGFLAALYFLLVGIFAFAVIRFLPMWMAR
ncbi:hypothetical protein LSM04_006406 [Trypanosoma melophagium]|uniref:uncharacterized protein n=1 Tax=Trypanosoma melophagium TaxID=715481 RepID=UPI003519F849|nr:hypothetical protein LSM04_006406 [Trypanosoma melophagium]